MWTFFIEADDLWATGFVTEPTFLFVQAVSTE